MRKYIAITIFFLICGYILLVLSMLIPNSCLKNNVSISASVLEGQGDYPSIFVEGAFLENFCDADYIAVAYNQRTDNPFYNAIDAYNYCYKENDGASRGVNGLYITFNGVSKKIYEHSHAWHGYRIFLRPLLIRYSVSEIRWINAVANYMMVLVISILMYKATGKLLSCIPFLFSYLFFNFQLESISIAISINLMLMLVPCIFVLYGCIKEKNIGYFSLIMYMTGLCSAYFALCDLPTLSIGFPIITMLAFCRLQYGKAQTALKLILTWLAGYAFEGIPKFIINEIFLKLNGASYSVIWYTGGKHKVGLMNRLIKIGLLLEKALYTNKIATDFLIMGLVVMFALIIIRKKYRAIDLKDIIAYLFVGLIPVYWVLIMIIASNIGWTIFIFSITIYATMQYLWKIICE